MLSKQSRINRLEKVIAWVQERIAWNRAALARYESDLERLLRKLDIARRNHETHCPVCGHEKQT